MATYLLKSPDGSRTYRLTGPDDAPPIEAAQAAIAQSAPEVSSSTSTTSTPTSQPGFVEKAIASPTGQAVKDLVVDPMAGAASRLLQFPGKQMGQPDMGIGGAAKEVGKAGLDIGTLVAPFLAPGLTAAQIATQSGAEHLGMERGNAHKLAQALGIVDPLGQLAYSGTRAGLGKQATAAAEEAKGGETFASAAARAQEKIPAAYAKRAKDAGDIYDGVRASAAQSGAAFDPANPAIAEVQTAVDGVRTFLGRDISRKTAGVLKRWETAAKSGQPIPYDVADRLNQELNGLIPAMARYGTAAQAHLARLKSIVSHALPKADGIAGTPVADALIEANRQWATEVIPYKNIAKFADTPGKTAVETGRRIFPLSDAEKAGNIGGLLGDEAASAQGVLNRLIESSPRTPEGYVDAGKLASTLHSLQPETQQLLEMGKRGSAVNTLLKTLKNTQLPQGGGDNVKIIDVIGSAAGGGLAFHLGAEGVTLPLATVIGFASPRLLALISRGLKTPAGSRHAAKLATMIAKETEGMRGQSSSSSVSPEP